MAFSSRQFIAAAVLLAAAPAFAAQPVNTGNFARAETDWVMGLQAKAGCFAKLCTESGPAAIDKQQVIRMNRDTPYSRGVFDLTSPVTITLPEAGGRFQSLQVVNQDHFVKLVAYKPGTYTLTQESVGTRYAFVIIRTFIDPASPSDVAAGRKVQAATVATQASPGRFETPDWDEAQRAGLHDSLIALAPFVPPGAAKFGDAGEVDPLGHLVGTAAGWGGNPAKDAVYLLKGVARNDGVTPYVLNVGAVIMARAPREKPGLNWAYCCRVIAGDPTIPNTPRTLTSPRPLLEDSRVMVLLPRGPLWVTSPRTSPKGMTTASALALPARLKARVYCSTPTSTVASAPLTAVAGSSELLVFWVIPIRLKLLVPTGTGK